MGQEDKEVMKKVRRGKEMSKKGKGKERNNWEWKKIK